MRALCNSAESLIKTQVIFNIIYYVSSLQHSHSLFLFDQVGWDRIKSIYGSIILRLILWNPLSRINISFLLFSIKRDFFFSSHINGTSLHAWNFNIYYTHKWTRHTTSTHSFRTSKLHQCFTHASVSSTSIWHP